MTISKDLLLSILSMDAYNQGYGKGLNHGKTQIGAASKSIESDVDTGTEAYSAGFYAVSYTIGAGVEDLDQNSTVISYRGTDNTHGNGEGGNDIWEGWTIGAGDIGDSIREILVDLFARRQWGLVA